MEDALIKMLKIVAKRTNLRRDDSLSIVATNPNFWYPISSGLHRFKTFKESTNRLCQRMARIVTSNESVDFAGTRFQVRMIAMPRGAGGGKKIINLAEDVKTKKCIVQIRNDYKLCCPRAVIVALTYDTNIILDRELSKNEITYIRKGRPLQKLLAQELCNRLGEYNEDGFTLDDIKNVEDLMDIQINVVCAENLNSIIYRGRDRATKIYLYKNQNHFDVISSMQAFLGSSYFCNKCNNAYSRKDRHICKIETKVCTMCGGIEHQSEQNRKYCSECNRYCYNQECFDNHKQVCDTAYKCKTCNKICLRVNEHKCGYSLCRNCHQEVEIKTHKCYMLPRKQRGGICEREIKDAIVRGCPNCSKDGCTVDGDKVPYHIFECSKCFKIIKDKCCAKPKNIN